MPGPGESAPIRYYLFKIVFAGIVILSCTWILLPIIISILYAFSTPQDFYNPKEVIPLHFTLSNIQKLLALGAARATMNSIIVAIMTVIFSFILGLPAGYAFARFAFKGKDSLKLLIIGLRMFPMLVIAIPLVTLYIRLGLNDTLLGVALAHTTMALPFVILITSSIFVSVPVELEEAGYVFGLDRKQTFFRITLPLSLPGLTAAAIFTFIMSWNEVFMAAVLTLTNRTLPAFILTSAMAAPDIIKFAASFIMILPALIFVFIARKYLVSMWGITVK
ncbi:MAG: carbohydrate ABC transporter permease [Crenarchaeota archaeon]|nr:carbohydrate ABC transporter permease [Thermoproteota archaeon]